MCFGVSVWLGWSGIRVTGWSTTCSWIDVCWSFGVIGLEWYPSCRLKHNNTINVVIQQNSRQLLMMDILMSKTCWARRKLNKIASAIRLVFYSSTITMMHCPINITLSFCLKKRVICASSPFERHYVAAVHYRSTVQRKLHSKFHVTKCCTAARVTVQVAHHECCSTILCITACTVHVANRFAALQYVVI